MSIKTVCPLPAAIGALSAQACQENFGQIVRVIFQRLGTPFPAAAGGIGDIDVIASWTALLAAVDGTKVSVAPLNENMLIPAGEAITEGGDDNTTTFGQAILVGAGQVIVTGTYRGLPAANQLELKAFSSEAAVYGNLGVYLVNEHGQFICDNKTGTELHPFPITSYFIGDVDSQGYNTHNKNNFQWNFKAGWSENFKIVEATDFDPLTDL